MITEIISELKRGYDALENKKFSEAEEVFNKVLKKDPENAQAYTGKLLAEKGLQNISQLEKLNESFEEDENYKKAVQYGEKDLVSALGHYLAAIKKRKSIKAAEEKRISCALEKIDEESESSKNPAEESNSPTEESESDWQKNAKKEQEILAEKIRLQTRKKHKKRRKIKLSLCLLILSVLMVISSIFISRYITKQRRLDEADLLFRQKKYTDAYIIYEEIEETKTTSYIKENVMLLASNSANDGDYDEAVTLLQYFQKTDSSLFRAYDHMRKGEYKEAVSLGLTKLTLPKGLKEVPNEIFCNVTSLEQIIIPEGVLKIGDFAFDGCTWLNKVVLPDSVIIIGENSFTQCSRLKEITIPKNVRIIERGAFEGCCNLSAIAFKDKIGWKTEGITYAFSSDELLIDALTQTLTGTWTKDN